MDVTEDAFLLALKNRLEMGDVLEFVPHTRRGPLLLRIYEFENVLTGRVTAEEGINAGQKPVIRIPFAWFHEEGDVERLRRDFPAYTVVRKEQALSEEAWARLELDRIAQAAETGEASGKHLSSAAAGTDRSDGGEERGANLPHAAARH